MKYKDDPAKNAINGIYVGERVGTPLSDALAPKDDGYDDLRGIVHVGTVLMDAADTNPTPIEE